MMQGHSNFLHQRMMGAVVLLVSHPLENEQALVLTSTGEAAVVAFILQVM